MTVESRTPLERYREIEALAVAGEIHAAVDAYEELLRAVPERGTLRAKILNDLGALRFGQGELRAAALMLRDAVALDPALPEARSNLEAALAALFDASPPWHHRIEVAGVPTKTTSAWGEPLEHPGPLWEVIEPHLGDLRGRRVLDVGCNDGFFLFAARRKGAAEVLGVEADGHHYQHAALVNELLDLGGIEVRNMSAYDLDDSLGSFDTTLLLGLIYHLKNPLGVLEKIAAMTTSRMILDTAVRNSAEDLAARAEGRCSAPALEFNEQPFTPTSDTALLLDGCGADESSKFEGSPNWWIPNSECVCAMLRTCGFSRTEVIDEFILEPGQAANIFGRAVIVAQR